MDSDVSANASSATTATGLPPPTARLTRPASAPLPARTIRSPAAPLLTPVTRPSAATVATPVLLLAHSPLTSDVTSALKLWLPLRKVAAADSMLGWYTASLHSPPLTQSLTVCMAGGLAVTLTGTSGIHTPTGSTADSEPSCTCTSTRSAAVVVLSSTLTDAQPLSAVTDVGAGLLQLAPLLTVAAWLLLLMLVTVTADVTAWPVSSAVLSRSASAAVAKMPRSCTSCV